MEKKALDQMTDAELDYYIATDPPFLVNAVEERSYRSSRRLLAATDGLRVIPMAGWSSLKPATTPRWLVLSMLRRSLLSGANPWHR